MWCVIIKSCPNSGSTLRNDDGNAIITHHPTTFLMKSHRIENKWNGTPDEKLELSEIWLLFVCVREIGEGK